MDFANIQTQQDVDNFNQTYNETCPTTGRLKVDPFKKENRLVEVDREDLLEQTKKSLNRPRKEVKFTWDGFSKATASAPHLYNPFFIKRLQELKEAHRQKKKDYIDAFEEAEKALYGGLQDLDYSISSLLTEGVDAVFDTDYLKEVDEK